MNTTRKRSLTRLCAVAGSTAVILTAGAFPAAAADGDVEVINTETVQAYTDATGEVQGNPKLYEQLGLTGEGSVELANPVETNGLRNLNGFSGLNVEDGDQMVELTVDGQDDLRSVSTYDEDLPLDISVDYVLTGRPSAPRTWSVRAATWRSPTPSATSPTARRPSATATARAARSRSRPRS